MDDRIFWSYMGAYALAMLVIMTAYVALQPSRELTFNERWASVPSYVSIRYLP